MLSANREDYIKKVFQMNEIKVKLTNKELALSLSVSPASSSEMVKKLIQSEHLVKDKDYGFKLTEKGRDEASKLIRNHRLWEVFLVEKLGFSWSEVHEEAELLEHVTSSVLGDRLNEFLSYPKYCPHGSIIYGNKGDGENLMLLSDLKINESGVIRRIEDNPDLLRYLEERGVRLNQSFVVSKIDPFEGPFQLKFNNEEILLSYKALSQIWIGKD